MAIRQSRLTLREAVGVALIVGTGIAASSVPVWVIGVLRPDLWTVGAFAVLAAALAGLVKQVQNLSEHVARLDKELRAIRVRFVMSAGLGFVAAVSNFALSASYPSDAAVRLSGAGFFALVPLFLAIASVFDGGRGWLTVRLGVLLAVGLVSAYLVVSVVQTLISQSSSTSTWPLVTTLVIFGGSVALLLIINGYQVVKKARANKKAAR